MARGHVGRVFRHKFDDTYPMRRAVWQRRDLSYEARAMVSFLMSLPPNQNLTVKEVEEICGIGRDKRQRIFKELEREFYIIRRAAYSKEKRRLVGWDYEFYDEPMPEGRLPDSARKPINGK